MTGTNAAVGQIGFVTQKLTERLFVEADPIIMKRLDSGLNTKDENVPPKNTKDGKVQSWKTLEEPERIC